MASKPSVSVCSRKHAIVFTEPSLTKQSFAQECDINTILERARNGQDISGMLNARVASYGNFSDFPDFRTAQDMVVRANGMFMVLPAKLRERFANDPGRLLDFMADPANRDEAVALGLLTLTKVEAAPAGESPVPGASGPIPGAPEGAPASAPKGASTQSAS